MHERVASFGRSRLDRGLPVIVATYLLVVAVIVGYNAREIDRERGAALIVNVAARQRALAERYVKDVFLRSQGIAADPDDDAAQLLANADALLHGGEVVAVQGADAEVHIPPASDDRHVVAKLEEEQRLLQQLVRVGEALIDTDPSAPSFGARLERLRVAGAQVTSISNDAVGQMTRDTEDAFARLVAVVVALGVLGAIAAIAMALLLRRTTARRSARFRSLVHNATDLITVMDADGTIGYESPSCARQLGHDPAALVGTSFFELVDAQDRDHVRGVLAEVIQIAGTALTMEYRVLHADGSTRCVESIVSNLIEDASVGGLVLNTRDVTDRKLLEEELAHQAFHDSLTGLSNRAVFRDRVDHALTRVERNHGRLAVLLLDLDGFKMINDGLGHDAGDHLLVAVGERLLSCARASDTVARLGGDEFAILLEDEGDVDRATGVAERLLSALRAPFELNGREVFIHASIGVALSSEDADTTKELIRNADTAMYAAKVAGKGRYEHFRPVMHARAVEKFEVQADLQRALGREEFAVHFQPIVDFTTGRISGIEALVRWMHPTRGLLPPAAFIGTAEETGLIVPLGRWVLGEACRRAADWRARYPDASQLWVSVNLSTRQLIEPDLAEQVGTILAETGLRPDALILEITEGSLMQDVVQTTAKLRELKDLGVRLAIDDFGTGSSSLGYLRTFPMDLLKIDKSFVDEVATGQPEGPALVKAIVELAQTLQLDTIAEGIEQDDQLAELRSVGCHSGQGFLFARPLQTEVMEAFLRDGGIPLTEPASGESIAPG